jgi:hypothetical protein
MEIEKHLDARGRSFLIISDLHIPYHHPDTIAFLSACKKLLLNKKSIIVNVGDEADAHALSFHTSISELDSAGKELEKARAYFSELHEIFPEMYLCESNHGSLIYRRARENGVPLEYIRPLSDVYGVTGWEWHDAIILKTNLGEIYICHGKSGTYGKLCKEVMMSAVQGHFHGKFEITWHRSPIGDRFNMFVGCLINYKELAFNYGKNHLPKPILGVGYVDEDGHPYLIKMDLDNNGKWTGKIR